MLQNYKLPNPSNTYIHMKNKILLSAAISFTTLFLNAQTWTAGTNILYSSPDTTKVGIGTTNPTERLHINNGALKIGNSTSQADRNKNLLKFGDGSYVQIGEWEDDDMLSFKASRYNFTNGNVGIGISNPQYKLDINGKLYLRTFKWENATAYSYLQWPAHNLVMGTPKGEYAISRIDLMSGGSNQGELYSEFRMFTAINQDSITERIHLNSSENCWLITPGYIGIGTTAPQAKLDVRGRIRADEVFVNIVSGADFVFDKSYKLRPLDEVQEYIQEHKHLPEIPSAAEMKEEGVNVNDLQIQLLQKIEELTLYIIEQDKRIKELEAQISK